MTIEAVDILVPAASTILGLAAGALFSEARLVVQGARERRRALRVLLFQIVEIRHYVARTDPDALLRVLSKVLGKDLGAGFAQAVSLPGPARDFFLKVAGTATAVLLPHDLGKRYAESVAALVPHDPILAYELGRRDTFLLTPDLLKRLIEQTLSVPAIAADPSTPSMISATKESVVEAIRKDSLASLADAAKEVAGSLSTLTAWRVGRVLRRQEDFESIEEDLEEALVALKSRFIPPSTP